MGQGIIRVIVVILLSLSRLIGPIFDPLVDIVDSFLSFLDEILAKGMETEPENRINLGVKLRPLRT